MMVRWNKVLRQVIESARLIRAGLRTAQRIVLLLLFAACAPGYGAARDSITVGMAQFPPDLHPYITETSIKNIILAAVTRPMTGFSKEGGVICDLCTEVPTVQNGRARVIKRPDGTEGMEVLFTLRSDLFWADGKPVTAKDVAFAFEVQKAFTTPRSVEKVEALGERTVKLTLKTVAYDFDRTPTVPAPIPEHIEGPIFRAAKDALDYGQKSSFNRKPEEPGLWNGPYRIVEFRPNERVVLTPNPHWKGKKPYFARVTMRLVENTSALQANVLAGDVDTVATGNLGLTLDQHLAMAKTHGARFDWDYIPSVASFEHLAVRLDNRFMSDKRVRQAMLMAIDRKTIVTKLFDNKFQVAQSFKHPTQPGWDPKVKAYPYDPKAARKLLADAGYTPGSDGYLVNKAGQKFSIALVTTAGNRVRELVEQVIQTQLKAVGIEVIINNEPARVMFGESLRKRTFTGLVLYQADHAIDAVPYTFFHSTYIPSAENSFTGTNYSGFANTDMDKALADGIAALEPAKRAEAYKRIMAIANEELPILPLYFPAVAMLTPKWMTGIVNPKRWGTFTLWIEDWRAR
jgi:peptide/nickel transport system substrate-binding protein